MSLIGKLMVKAGLTSDGSNVHFHKGDVRVTGKVTSGVRSLLKDNNGNILLATGTTVPSGISGYAKGCLFIDTDITAGSTGIYENVGTVTVCNFDQIGSNTTLADDAIDTAQLAADAVTGTEIEDDAISLEHLDDGILPSHVVKYAGEFTWSGSGASVAETVTGALATDIVVATIQSAPTEAASMVSTAVTANTVTVTLSAANTSNDAVISYVVYRVAA